MAKALDKFADAIDDAINKLWTQIGIDAAVIAGGVALAFFTAGLASGAAVAAADAIIEFGATMGIAVHHPVGDSGGHPGRGGLRRYRVGHRRPGRGPAP